VFENDSTPTTIQLSRFTEPAITVTLTEETSGVYRYDYVLSNGPSAKQKAWRWMFEGVVNDVQVGAIPDGWNHSASYGARAQVYEWSRSRDGEIAVVPCRTAGRSASRGGLGSN
jgi:hypothetical protein